MNNSAEVAKNLLQIKAIKLSPQSPFTWASGIQSPIYCDNRIVLSHPDIRDFVKFCLVEGSKTFSPFNAIAGVATAGIAHGILLADALGLPFSYVRSEAKGHGRKNQIEGEISGEEKILIVEDLISTGGSSLRVVDILREKGCEVIGVLAIFSYGFESAIQAFLEANCPLHTLTNYDVLIEEALKSHYISAADLQQLLSWRKMVGVA
ncbi:MAG: orotate phosphoribosyltransferase [Saprospirales bacterium]|nr:orotate phosphoribosyltransferase [Saprospirales bacterium]MBK8490351.1 orotate phosphoribosyltransferase [Saprospirales bacterium]